MLLLKEVLVVTLFGLATACLITNCPKGGKRSKPVSSLQDVAILNQVEEPCTRCGPGLQGRCLGPAVCCGPRVGCLVGAPGLLTQCGRVEPTMGGPRNQPCLLPSGLGECASDGVCCNLDSCSVDLSCEMSIMEDACLAKK